MSLLPSGIGIGEDWVGAVKACLEDLGPVGPESTLGFLYVTEPLAEDLPSILTFLRQKTHVEHWAGAVGVGVRAGRKDYLEEKAVSVLLGDFPEGAVKEFRGTDQEDLRGGMEPSDVPYVLVHCDPRNDQIEGSMAGLSWSSAGWILGGAAVVNKGRKGIAGLATDEGISGVLINLEPGKIVSGISQGCTPIGPLHGVTDWDENVVWSLDGRPALEVLKEDIGEVLARDIRRACGFIHTAIGSETDYRVRPLLGVDPSGQGVAIAMNMIDVALEDGLLFVKRDPAKAEANLRQLLRELKQKARGPLRGGIAISSPARAAMFEGREMEVIAEELGDISMTGFLGNGEIFAGSLHHMTCVLMLFT